MAKKADKGGGRVKKSITSTKVKTSKIYKRSHIGDSEASIKNTQKAAEIPPKKKKDK